MRRILLVGALAAALAPAAQAVPSSFRGLDCDALGAASALVWSPRSNVAELRVANIGSSGEDGVTVAMPDRTSAWVCAFGPAPDGTSPPEDFALSLFDSDLPGAPPVVTWSFVATGGRQRCVPDLPGALDWLVEVWSGDSLVHSGRSLSPPVVDLPAGVSACGDGTSLGVVTNMRTRLNQLEARLQSLGLLTVNGVDLEGDRVRIGGHCAQGNHIKSAKLYGKLAGGGGGGGGAGGFSVRAHTPRVGIGVDVPASPLGFAVGDGAVLGAPPAPLTGATVQLGPGMSAMRVSFLDLSRPGSPLARWSMDMEPLTSAELAGGAQAQCVLPSSWSSGPDTLRLALLDEGLGLGPTLSVSNEPGARGVTLVAYSGDVVVPLAESPPGMPAVVSLSQGPTGFHALASADGIVVRCPMPPGEVVYSGGFAWPCDSIEARVSAAPAEACTGLLPGTLAMREVNQRHIPSAGFLHMHQYGRRGGVAMSASGDARLQRLGGDLLIHGVSETGEDGVVLHGGGGALRVRLKDHFQNGDIPVEQQFTARATLADGSTEDVSTLAVVHTEGVGGDLRVGARVHCIHRGTGRLFVQLSDGSTWEPEDCDDEDDGFMDFRQLVSGTTSMVGSVGIRRDSPWTEVFDVGFTGPMLVTVQGADRQVTGFRVWRNRGGETIGSEAPPVSALRVTGRPPAAPAQGPAGVCGFTIEGVELHSAGPGIEAHGPGSTIGGHPVVATWVAVTRDSTDGVDDDCDGGGDDEGITLRVGDYRPVVIDKKFPPAGPGGPVLRGIAFTGDFSAAHAVSESVVVDVAVSGSVLGVPGPRLYGLAQRRKYNYHDCFPMMANTPDPLLVRCFSGGALVSEFPLADSIRTTLAPSSVVVDDCDDDGRGDFQLDFPPGALVQLPGGIDQDCDRIEVHASGPQEPSSLDGGCVVTLNGLPPGVPVSGLRLAMIPDADPTLGVAPGGARGVFALARPWPNPARGVLRARFALPVAGAVRARVFDVAGRVVATLADARFAAGEHELAWDGRADGGAVAPAGLYFLRVTRDGRDALAARFTRLR